MTMPIALSDITIHPVIEQQGAWFDATGFFPALTKELLDENRSWLQSSFLDQADKLVLCIQSFVIKTRHHNILIDACVGNHKTRPTRPFWNKLNSDRFEKSLSAAGLTVNNIDYVMCTHLHTDHVGWNTRLENGRWVPTFPKA
ncbi:MAG: MBL fold metallo-hydrolase, partial [Xanthobacteraceae bacterium]